MPSPDCQHTRLIPTHGDPVIGILSARLRCYGYKISIVVHHDHDSPSIMTHHRSWLTIDHDSPSIMTHHRSWLTIDHDSPSIMTHHLSRLTIYHDSPSIMTHHRYGQHVPSAKRFGVARNTRIQHFVTPPRRKDLPPNHQVPHLFIAAHGQDAVVLKIES